MPVQQKLKSKGRKIGRNKRKDGGRYLAENRKVRNKIMNLKRHIARKAKEIARKALRNRTVMPDLQAINALKRLT